MALGKEMMGSSVVGSSFFVSSTKVFLTGRFGHKVAQERRRVAHLRKSLTSPVAAISEDLVRFPPIAGKPVKFKARAVVTVRNKDREGIKEAMPNRLDAFTDKIGQNVVLQIFSTEVDPKTKAPKKSKEGVLRNWSKKSSVKAERVSYAAEFLLDSYFGEPGAITVSNKHQQEFFLETITIEGFPGGPVHFPCNSWVQSRKDHPEPRIFFSNKPYLPGETPAGLRVLRERDLNSTRGDGKGVRKLSDRIYDFDQYNDLGNPDKGAEFARPVLGGKEIPYPRRCRTGRIPTDSDLSAESRVEKPLPMYVPRDEQFEESKQDTFALGRLKAVMHSLIPLLKVTMSTRNHDFKSFAEIDSLYSNGLLLELGLQDELLQRLPLPEVVRKIRESSPGFIKYDAPKILSKDKFAWLRDDEFARQAIAGINPVKLERLTVFPPISELDPEVYGPVESALKEEHISGQLNGMTVQQALEEKKLFMIDYHDIYLPFLERMNSIDGRKAYATRTIFFLTPVGTLKPVAIELSLPPTVPISRRKRVVTPPADATGNWQWQLAKAHVCSNDAGAHQLVNHWLRTHAALEPFILSAHRQLSVMHPIYKLLDPHMRYTLEINALARQALINADGIIETCFSPGRYSMEMSAAAYKSFWRFDLESLPADLIRRGMAEPDPTKPHGIKLVIEDYPYAADGLLVWSAIENWVRTYVNHYYPDPSLVSDDIELQAWYREAVNVGHADLRHESWWPTLTNADDLSWILTILIWLSSAQHAALNFGQYPYGGYVPNRPTLMRKLIPEENDPEYNHFITYPEKYFLSALPSILQSAKIIAVIDTLSTHSPDEEYLGMRPHLSTWTGDLAMIEAFYEFSFEMSRVEKEIDRRNNDEKLKNRCGAGVIPYELLAPSSEPGVTCRGVPNSVTI